MLGLDEWTSKKGLHYGTIALDLECRTVVDVLPERSAVSTGFCGNCGSALYVPVSTRLDIVGVRVCTLDDPSWFQPEANVFTKSAQPWDWLDPAVPRFETYPAGRSY